MRIDAVVCGAVVAACCKTFRSHKGIPPQHKPQRCQILTCSRSCTEHPVDTTLQ